MKHTTQRLEEDTLDRVRDFGKMGESFNRVLNRLLDKIDDLEDQLDEQEVDTQVENDLADENEED